MTIMFPKINKQKINVDTEEEKEPDVEQIVKYLAAIPEENQPLKMRVVGLCGEINEEILNEIIFSMLVLKDSGRKIIPDDPDDPDSNLSTIFEPFDLVISTWGGIAMDMFAIYDALRMIKEDCEVGTIGLGKVMSAGVLLLASGTKGRRRIGKNCRIMLHSVVGGNHGAIYNLENEMEEVRWIQDRYISCLVEETNMTKRRLKKMLERKVNVYLTAEEAVELGIVDEII